MLSIRMQRLGRKGHPMYRVVVQDKRQSPDSGKYIALLGSYDPHAKTVTLAKDKAEFYLNNGAQPSERVVKLFKSEKIALPSWIKETTKQERKVRNPEKLRKNRPADAPAEPTEGEAEKPTEETAQAEAPAAEQQPEAETPAEEIKEEAAKPTAEDQAVSAEKSEEQKA